MRWGSLEEERLFKINAFSKASKVMNILCCLVHPVGKLFDLPICQDHTFEFQVHKLGGSSEVDYYLDCYGRKRPSYKASEEAVRSWISSHMRAGTPY